MGLDTGFPSPRASSIDTGQSLTGATLAYLNSKGLVWSQTTAQLIEMLVTHIGVVLISIFLKWESFLGGRKGFISA